MTDTTKIKEHMEVLGADGKHVGTVDHMQGADRIKLMKNDPAANGEHHLIPVDWIDHVDTHVHLSKDSAEAMRSWERMA
jgi:hypothetical protein